MAGKITFSNARGVDYVAGPCATLIFKGQLMFMAGHTGAIAEHQQHEWVTKQGSFLRVDCGCSVTVRFKRAEKLSERFGPFQHFSSMDGVAYGDRQVVAFCDAEHNDWYSTRTQTHWDSMLVELAEPKRRQEPAERRPA